MSATNLMPRIVPNVPEAIQDNKRKVKYQYDKSTRRLPSLEVGDPVFVQLNPDVSKTWVPAEIKNKLSERSYLVERNGTTYRRDVVHVKPRNVGGSSFPIAESNPHEEPTPNVSLQLSSSLPSAETPGDAWRNTALLETQSVDQSSKQAPAIAVHSPNRKHLGTPVTKMTPQPERMNKPKREVKMPTKFKDYVMS